MSLTSDFVLPRTGKKIRNRTVLAAMTNKQSFDDGTLSDEEINWLLRRADGGFGIITTAASHVSKSGKSWEGEMGVWGDHQISKLSKLANGIRERGSIGLVQIFHGGLRAPRSLTSTRPVSASINLERGVEEESRELSNSEIENLIKDFGNAAKRCEQAGFDGVEIHGAHGYLISQFLGTRTNRRKDMWGGELVDRSLFLKKIIECVRQKTSEQFIICVRISPEHDVGITIDDSLKLAKILVEMNIDILHISCWDIFSGASDDLISKRTITSRFSEFLQNRIPLLTTGSIWNEEDGDFALSEGADLVGVARVAIAHPDWANKLGNSDYMPIKPPFTPEHLMSAELSPIFIDYMRRWKGFVTDGK